MAAAGGAEGVAAKIKAEEADAKARIAAIEYLATVDCRYWPEAEGTLVDRLRADRNECVRYAAARALGTGCCCTKKTIAGLKLVVECTDSDGNPAERSERVKAAAWYALNHCVTRYVPPRPAPRERPSESPRREYPASYERDPRAASSYEEALADTPDEVLIEDARRALDAARNAPLGERTLPTGSRSVFNVMAAAARRPRRPGAARRARGRDPVDGPAVYPRPAGRPDRIGRPLGPSGLRRGARPAGASAAAEPHGPFLGVAADAGGRVRGRARSPCPINRSERKHRLKLMGATACTRTRCGSGCWIKSRTGSGTTPWHPATQIPRVIVLNVALATPFPLAAAVGMV